MTTHFPHFINFTMILLFRINCYKNLGARANANGKKKTECIGLFLRFGLHQCTARWIEDCHPTMYTELAVIYSEDVYSMVRLNSPNIY